ncbi:MAG: polyphosphate kinase 1 [Bacteroidales bacterium]|nr:polyphosphate kinase 1 [Bacteroidales bacterium]
MAISRNIINREISWLSFNERVLQEAADVTVPLLERLHFLGIFSNNLDEFFKVRVASIKRMIDIEEQTKKTNPERPKRILGLIQNKVLELQKQFQSIYSDILEELKNENIFLINETQLSKSQIEYVKEYFDDNVLSQLSPIMLSNVEEFPYLKDKSIYFATKLTRDETHQIDYALLEIPTDVVSRFIVLPSKGEKRFIIILDDLIRYCLRDVFAIFQYDKIEAYTIKLTRDAELDIDNDLSISILEKISKGVSSRSHGQPVRFVYDQDIAPDMLKYIISKLGLGNEDNLIPGGRYHNFKDYMNFPRIGGDHLKYKNVSPLKHELLYPSESKFPVIASRDIFLHCPYHKFDHYINLLREAAIDPNVKSIKTTVYRAARNSKVINALISAARNGKLVTVVIELQARFDEESNIHWSRKLEEVGAKVLFGIPGYKVHAKLTLITRRENRKLMQYACISTGNFHEGNALVYSDLTLMTSDRRITSDVAKAFNFFENPIINNKYNHLILSPLFTRKKMYKLIENEIRNAKSGKEAYIILKVNSLVDKEMISKLYKAHASGVKIKIIVRGMCSLTPGVPGFSDNIEAISIVDKYLEHARIFVFCNNGNELYFISSADWMPRNLDHRIEATCPIYDQDLKNELKTILNIQLKDDVKARIINEKQDNPYKKGRINTKGFRSQEEVFKYYKNRKLS